ncbi:MAG TPA: hypothetical protein VJ746_07490 [Nitrospira sp.]|nr:hypothetical protein [Nitrospira sp.]
MRGISGTHRAFGILVILFVLGGLCWLDILDFTDDIQASHLLIFEEQGVEPEDVRDDLSTAFYAAAAMWWACLLIASLQGKVKGRVALITLQSNRPLYQHLCTYRI